MTKLVTKLQPGGTTPEGLEWMGPMLQAMYEKELREKGVTPVTANNIDNTGALKELYQEALKLVPKADITESNSTRIVPKTIPTGGISVDPSGTLVAGNYLNISALNASQRRLLRKNGGQYVGRNGQIYTIGAGTSRAEMRRAVNQLKKDLAEYEKLKGLGLVDDTNDVFEAYSKNPTASYVRYNPEGFKELKTQGGTSPSSYRYSFSGGLNANNGIGNLYLQLVNGMTPEQLSRYANDGVINNDSMIRYIREAGGLSDFNGTDFSNENMTALNSKLNTNYTWVSPSVIASKAKSILAPALNSWTKSVSGDWLTEDRIKLLEAVIRKFELNPELLDNIQINKQGGKMNKFQYGGAVNQQQVAQEQAQAQQQQLTEIFQAIAQKPKETLMALQKQGIQPKLIIDLAQKMSDKNPAAKAALQALSQMQQMAKEGAKLQYIKRLRGQCPEGYELKMFKAGGKVCTKCEKIKEEKKGGQVKGDESDVVKEFKSKRCGGKMKK